MPGQLVSLDNMLRIYADQYVSLGRKIEHAGLTFHAIEAQKNSGTHDELSKEESADQDCVSCGER